MFDRLDDAPSLTRNQLKVVAAAVIGDMLEFFDYSLIGFVLAFILTPWRLTGGQSAIILSASGIGAICGGAIWGRIADVYGRRRVFILTIVNFSLASGLIYFTPTNGWVYLSLMRFFVGFGVGGLYCVDLPLVQEFVPTRMRGFFGGLVTALIPLGVMLASSIVAFFSREIGWRGLFIIGLFPAAVTFAIRSWIPESPRWLMSQGRHREARESLAWALRVPAASLPLPESAAQTGLAPWSDLFRHPRSLAVSWLTNLGAQSASSGIALLAPTLFVLQLGVTPARAAFLYLWVTVAGLAGRIGFSLLSEIIGRRPSGLLVGVGGTVFIAAAGLLHNQMIGAVSVFWLLIVCASFFFDGGFAIVGPYMAEVWPTRLRVTGMGSAYAFGGLGKIFGPMGLALMIGASNVIKPQTSVQAIVPAFLYFAAWMALCGLAFLVFGFETGRQSIAEIDRQLENSAPARAGAAIPNTSDR